MTFKRYVPIRSKTVIDNTIMEQVDTFTYLRCKIGHEKEDMTSNISTFLQFLRF
jgi:hypothetical protein